jgi:hypothetical protein
LSSSLFFLAYDEKKYFVIGKYSESVNKANRGALHETSPAVQGKKLIHI